MNKSDLIFIATYPDKNGQSPKFLEDLASGGYKILHPAYNYESPEGVEMIAKLKTFSGEDLPKDSNPWRALQLKDYYGIKHCYVVVYDLDREPGPHFLTAACIYGIPVIAVSRTLAGVPAYFSGSVSVVVKPEDLVGQLKAYST